MESDRARVIANWKPVNSREAATMKELLLYKLGVMAEHHPGGTGKLMPNNGRLVR